MIVIENLAQVVAQIETERGIPKESILSAIEQALVSACRRRMSDVSELEATLDQLTGEANVFQKRAVVESVVDPAIEVSLEEAKALDKSLEIGDTLTENVTPNDFGRLAAQTAKQVIIQRIREAEKTAIYDEFIDKVGKVIIGTVQRIENQNYLLNLGRTEAVLNFRNQIPGEDFVVKDRVKVYVEGIDNTPRGSLIKISRTHPGLLRALFESEIPEIQDGIIEIVSVSREPGKRAKVAVKTNNASIGAVGTCVGHMGSRIQSIIKELGFEKIDVLEWDENPKVFISNALKPAKIAQVVITNDENREAIVVVPQDQLSLAIGKSGINVRLSVKLTNWKLDIMDEEAYRVKAPEIEEIMHVSIVDRIKQEKLKQNLEEAENVEAVEELTEPESVSTVEIEPIKVSDLAKALGMKTKELILEAAKHNVEIKSVRSKLTPEQTEKLKEKIT